MENQLPARKHNRYPEYDYSQNGAYFITICTQDRRKILCNIVGDGFPVPKVCGTIAEKYIQSISQKYPHISVDKYVIMPDHIHLILRIDCDICGTGNPSPTVGNVIGWFKYGVTKEINTLYGTKGTRIFQRSYYDHVIRNGQDYNEVWEYIDNNPLKWVLKKEGEV